MDSVVLITVCYNNLDDVIVTCKSVDSQTILPAEHLIIDGSTNSNIKEYLEKTYSTSTYRRWICEPDRGIYDAMNKGIINSSSKLVVMLNSGDSFYDEYAIAHALEAFRQDASLKWIHAKYRLLRGGKFVIIGKPFSKKKIYRGMRSVCHQTMFIKRELYQKYGLYNTSYTISGDYEFLCRIAGEKFRFIETVLINIAPAGISSINYLKGLAEGKRAYESNYGKSWLLVLWQFRLKVLYFALKSPVGIFLYRIKTYLKLENF